MRRKRMESQRVEVDFVEIAITALQRGHATRQRRPRQSNRGIGGEIALRREQQSMPIRLEPSAVVTLTRGHRSPKSFRFARTPIALSPADPDIPIARGAGTSKRRE